MEDYEEFEKQKKALRIKYILITVIVAVIVAVAASEFTLYYYSSILKLDKKEASENSEENIDVIAKTLKSFSTVIDQYYIGEIDQQKVLDETIKGYVNGLDDEYSQYMTTSEWNEFQADALGNYVGIGIYMSVDKNNNVVVVSPIKDTPAEKAGLQTGDIIAYVNDESVLGIDSDIVSSKIKGEEGSTVKLEILRGTETKSFELKRESIKVNPVEGTKVKITVLRENKYIDFEIERKAIKVYHVESEMLQNNIGYISLLTFDEGCANELKSAYESLKSQGAQKIILDLRNNTGGLVDEALKILDMFLPKGATELITVDAQGEKDISKAEEDSIIDCDVVVLVNEYSASASEIVVGALKDQKKATLVGKTTYGKGVIQNVFMLNDGSALKLTVSEYFTPNETKINKVGIAPDYEVDLNDETEEDEQLNKAIEILK